jgi:hypothetical protein
MNALIATRVAAIAGISVAAVTVTAAGCGTANKNAPDQTGIPSTPASSSASPGPTLTESEKVLSTTGPNQFAPSEKARPAPTALPGRHGRQ